MGMIDEQFKNSELKVLRQALHAALQREGFAVKERDEAREVFQTAMELSKKYKDERDKYKIGHDRYEKLRRLNLREMKELYLKHLRSLEHFDTLVDQL